MPEVVIFSFFSGVGIMDLAFENNGYKIVLVNEYQQKFLEAYKFSRNRLGKEQPLYGYTSSSADVYLKRRNKRRLKSMIYEEKRKGNIVGFIGGPPCPDFSVGGKNKGAKGENGRLTRTYFDLIVRCQPDFFLFENVKGLVKTEKHKTFYNEMKMKIKNSNYSISDKLINALSYGVPQHRERIMMIGFNDTSLNVQKILPVIDKNFDFPWDRYAIYDADNVLHLDWPGMNDFIEDGELEFLYDVPRQLTVNYWFEMNEVENHINQPDQFTIKKGREKIETTQEGDTRRKSFKRLHRWRYSPTAAYGNNEVHLHPFKARRLSAAEAMAIQTLPKEFELPSSLPLTYKFKMIGNGVPYLLAEAIAKTVCEVIANIVEEE